MRQHCNAAGSWRWRRSTARACVALMSDWFPKTTGSIVHVDGGFHAIAV